MEKTPRENSVKRDEGFREKEGEPEKEELTVRMLGEGILERCRGL